MQWKDFCSVQNDVVVTDSQKWFLKGNSSCNTDVLNHAVTSCIISCLEDKIVSYFTCMFDIMLCYVILLHDTTPYLKCLLHVAIM